MKIIVFTDIHYCALKGNLDFTKERFERGLAHAQKNHRDADLLVVTGDLTNKGDVESFQEFSKSFAACELQSVVMIGNHDRRDNFVTVFPNTKIDENGFVQQVIDTEHAKLIFLDTVNGPPYEYPKSHAGYLCEDRLAWLDNQLNEAGQKQVVIFMHHPPHKTGFAGMDFIRLINGPEFYSVLEKYNNVRQIVAGHIHRTISGSHRGVPFAVFKSTTLQMPMLLESNSTELEVDEPPAYGILLINEDGITVHTEDYGLTDYDQL